MTDNKDFTDDAVVDVNDNNIPPENSEAVEKNKEWIERKYREEFEVINIDGDSSAPAWRKQNADILDRVKFVDESGKESEDVRAKAEETIWEIAKSEVLRDVSFDFGFMQLKDERKLMVLRAELSDAIARTTLGVVGISPAIDKNREHDGKVEAEELAKADAKLSIQALDAFLSDKGKDKAEVSESKVIGAALHESEAMERHITYIENKGYSDNLVNSFKNNHVAFGEKMKSFFGNAWTSAKEYVANNRTRLIVDTVATLAVALNPASYAAVAAYAAYAAAGSWGWPIVEKRKKAIRKAKREGRNYEDYKLGLTFNGLRKAWKDIKSDEKEWKRYKNRALTGTGAGVLVGAGLGALGTGLISGVDALAAKVGGTISRALASVTSQGLNFRDARKDLKLEDSEENRAAYKSAKWGLVIGGTVATLVTALGAFNLSHSHPDTDMPKSNLKGADDQAQEAAQKATKKTAKVAKKVAKVVEKDVDVSKVKVPTEWTPESGVSQDVWADVHGGLDSHGHMRAGKVTGILARTNEGFDRWNLAQKAMYGDSAKELLKVSEPKVTIQDIYQNIANARANNPKIFGDMTDQQVFVSYVKLVEQTEKVMNGPKIEINGKTVSTLISKIDNDGLPMYNNEYVNGNLVDHNSNMKKLFLLIRCGKKVDISAADVQGELSRIDLKSGRGIGEAFSHGVTNNVMVGEQGCNNGVSIWRKGINAVKKVFTEVKTVQTKELEPVDAEVKTVQPVDADVRSVQFRPLEAADADVKSIQSDEKIIMGRGTSHEYDNDLTDPVAQKVKKVGASILVKDKGGNEM